jgi:hypothetical protein
LAVVPKKGIPHYLPAMGSDEQEVGASLGPRRDDRGKRIVLRSLRIAGDTVEIFQPAGKFAARLAGRVHLVINDPAGPVVTDHMYHLQNGILRLGKDAHASARPIRPFRKIGRRQDYSRGLPSCSGTDGKENTQDRPID